MASNFNSFSPYYNLKDKFSAVIFISAQDRLEEVIVDLRAIDCNYESEIEHLDHPSDWPPLTLEGFKIVRMFIKEYNDDILHGDVVGVPMQPLNEGKVLFRFPGKMFGHKYGRYVGLIEVEYKGSDRSGNRILTARNYIPFDVREDFYCDPFDPDFLSCAEESNI